MTITNEILSEVINHLSAIAEHQSDFEFDTQMHRDYLSTLALLAKVQSLQCSLGDGR